MLVCFINEQSLIAGSLFEILAWTVYKNILVALDF